MWIGNGSRAGASRPATRAGSVTLTVEQVRDLRHKVWAYGLHKEKAGRYNLPPRVAASILQQIRAILPVPEED